MTLQELELLIQQGEGYNLEFKQSIPSKASELAEEICAFANAAGGTLLIGVDDKGKIVGVSMNNTNRSRLQNILNCIEPRVEVTTIEVTANDKTVLCIVCNSGKEKPYTVSGSIIVRNGPNSEKITSVQRMRDFFQLSDRIFFDEGVCKKFKYPHDFDGDLFSDFLNNAGISNVLPGKTILANLQLVQMIIILRMVRFYFLVKSPRSFTNRLLRDVFCLKGQIKHISLTIKFSQEILLSSTIVR